MKILLTGGNGMLGRTLRQQWQDFDVVSTDLPDADKTNAAGIDKIISGIKPDAVVLVATIRALKYNGYVPKAELGTENLEALEKGIVNLEKHIENLKKFGVPVVG